MIKIIVSNTMLDSFDKMIQTLSNVKDDYNSSNIVIVPDKFSLNAERRIFDVLNFESTFNIDVMSFNRLAYRVLSGKNLDVMSKRKGVMIVNKLLIENKDKLQSFSKLYSSNGLAENVYETIMQFKSSGILPNELTTNSENEHLSKKLQDLFLIYALYERTLSTKNIIDESNRLKLLGQKIITSDLVDKSNVYIGMFDSFTHLQLQVIKQLMIFAKNFTICVSANTIQANSHIYVNETLRQIIDLCNECGIEYEIENHIFTGQKEQQKISKELFGVNHCEKFLTDKIKIYKADNSNEEIEFVAKKIKEYVAIKNYNYSDFNIAVASLASYKYKLETIFNSYNIPYYIDILDNYSSNFVVKFLLCLCTSYFSNLRQNSVMEFIKYNFINAQPQIKDYFENYCIKYGIDGYKFNYSFNYDIENEYHKEIEQFRSYVVGLLNNFKNEINNSSNSLQYSKVIIEILESLSVEKCIERYINENELSIVDKKNLSNIYEKLMLILQEIDSVLGETKLEFKTYFEILSNILKTETFTSVPLKVNSVFIGDASTSYFYKEKIIFIMNAVEGNLPTYKNDCGIITDNEILKLNSYNILNPSIKQINKREKFKAFNLINTFNEELFITYACNDNGKECKPSEVVYSIEKLFDNRYLLTDKNSHFDMLVEKYGFGKASIIDYGNAKNIIKDNIKLCKETGEEIKLEDCLNQFNIYKKIKHKNEYNLETNNIKSLTGRTSVSRIENFNSCPFKFFCNYVLRVKQNEEFGMRVLDIGNILHLVAEKFVNYYIENNYIINNETIYSLSNKFFNDTLSQLSLQYLEKNSIQILSLKEESYKLCKIIVYQAQNSQFKPQNTEYSFKNFKLADDVLISGKIDRVDVFENYFNIIDYKTGKDKFSFADIFTGRKLQILIYCYILEQLTKNKCFGCFYMPVTNDFVEQEEDRAEKYKLSGVMLNNNALVKSMDNKLEYQSKSDIINVAIKKDGEFNSNSINRMLTNEEFESLKKYAIEMLLQTNNKIKKGEFEPSPLGSEMCAYCEYSSICNYSIQEKGFRPKLKGVSKYSFLKGAEDGQD